ncbi:MAG TPA: hypothetical protein VGM06_00380 [Polyangiaceae bacterium]|jgi:hypothetical protein
MSVGLARRGRFGRGFGWAELALTAMSGCATGAATREPPVVVEVSPVAAGEAPRPPPRSPDGVVLDPPSAVPNATERAGAEGVVALRQPLGDDAVRDVVRAVADAWQSESVDQLVALLTEDAGPIEARTRGRAPLVDGWRQRMHAHEYSHLAGIDLFRADRIERYYYDDLAARDAPPRPPDMRKDEIYVRVPIEVTRYAGERLFGDAFTLLLRRDDGRYKISAYGETDGP